ncbi:hypothetical protein GJ496_008775 [Pomphorhynchus laevis]|nr:hypothetical protein GJ496_008775 [Pomphorhynchus laevis]
MITRNVKSLKCVKMDILQMSIKKSSNVSVVFITSAFSIAMSKYVIPAKVGKVESMALVDTGSSDNFIDDKFAHNNQLNFMSYNQAVNMASVSQFK